MRNDEQHESISDCKGLRQKKNGSPRCTGLRHLRGSDRIFDGQDVFAGKTLAGVMGILIFAALATPIFRILRRAYRRACAHRIAGVLLPLTEESLTFERLETVLSSGNALEQLQSLIGKGYLQNLRIDLENRTVGLYIPEGALVQWVCASCGAKNRARRGGPMRCKYCDQPRGQ
ncbi:MAG: hypothetical protein ACLS7Z_10615 [Christensenellales bacterium]